ncbi:hypothetical protein VUR80DRAFT_4474 [Thermomyces stellatus]
MARVRTPRGEILALLLIRRGRRPRWSAHRSLGSKALLCPTTAVISVFSRTLYCRGGSRARADPAQHGERNRPFPYNPLTGPSCQPRQHLTNRTRTNICP